jgi:hypothetical protein
MERSIDERKDEEGVTRGLEVNIQREERAYLYRVTSGPQLSASNGDFGYDWTEAAVDDYEVDVPVAHNREHLETETQLAELCLEIKFEASKPRTVEFRSRMK